MADTFLSSAGIQESFHEGHTFPVFQVFCDALTLQESSLSIVAAEIAEKAIKQYLYNHLEKLTEYRLTKALDKAHIALCKQFNHTVKVSIVLIAELLPNNKEPIKSRSKTFLIVNAGDANVYHLHANGLTLLFEDPTIPLLAPHHNKETRFHTLKHALGGKEQPSPKVDNIEIDIHDQLVVASFGLYHRLNAKKIQQLGDNTSQKYMNAIPIIAKMKFSGNNIRCFVLRYEDTNTPIPDLKIKPTNDPEAFPIYPVFQSSNLRYYITVLSLMLLTTLSIFGVRAVMKSQRVNPLMPIYAASSHSIIEETTLKVPMKFALPKEESALSFIGTLKEQNQKQAELIQKQASKIRAQNITLRALHAKIRDPQAIRIAQISQKRQKSLEEDPPLPHEKLRYQQQI